MSKINILFVEDGSVDLDQLEDKLKDGQVVVYRQGARQPYILTMEGGKDYKSKWEKLKRWVSSKTKCRELRDILYVMDEIEEE